MRSPRYLYQPLTPFFFFLYGIHYPWGVGEASDNFFSFFDPIRGPFCITMYIYLKNVVVTTTLPKYLDKKAGVFTPRLYHQIKP